jgi:site-specific DNA-cytosine methylase
MRDAGFDVHGVEIDRDACLTHRAMVGPCDEASIVGWRPGRTYDAVGGGVPCPDFSPAGKRGGTATARGRLYLELLRIAREASARCCFLENSPGILSTRGPDGRTAIEEIEAAFARDGWLTTRTVLNAANYGVPQLRKRVFLVGFRARADLACFRWPVPTHAGPDDPLGLMAGRAPWVTVRQALGLGGGAYATGRLDGAPGWQGMRGLDVDAPGYTIGTRNNADKLAPLDAPACVVTASDGSYTPDPARASRRPLAALPAAGRTAERRDAALEATECDCGHLGRDHQWGDRECMRCSCTGLVPVPDVLDAPALTVSAGGTGSGGGAEPFPNADYRRNLGAALATAALLDRPSTTVDTTNGVSPAGNHGRAKPAVRLSLEQLAVLQGFPPGWTFCGKTSASRHKQCGNAVPIAMAAALGASIYAALFPGR